VLSKEESERFLQIIQGTAMEELVKRYVGINDEQYIPIDSAPEEGDKELGTMDANEKILYTLQVQSFNEYKQIVEERNAATGSFATIEEVTAFIAETEQLATPPRSAIQVFQTLLWYSINRRVPHAESSALRDGFKIVKMAPEEELPDQCACCEHREECFAAENDNVDDDL